MAALPVNWLRINHSTLVRLGQMTDHAIVCRKERQRTEIKYDVTSIFFEELKQARPATECLLELEIHE